MGVRWLLLPVTLVCYTAKVIHLEAPLKLSKLDNDKTLYKIHLVVNGQPIDSVIDTGSTGLVVANKNALRKTKSCKTSPVQCAFQSEWKVNFVVCYGDGTGYFVQPDAGVDITFGNVPKTKIMLGRAVGVFDPDGSMLTGGDQVFESVFGFGAHGGQDCSFSQKDAITDILNSLHLPIIWSLRSVTATGEGRLYLGTSFPLFHIWESQQYTGLIQYAGRYSAILSGLIVSSIGARTKSSTQKFTALECVLDTGSSATLISDENAMRAFLNVLGELVCHGAWSTRTAPNFGDYTQHSCPPTPKWEGHTVVFLFNDGGQSAALPVTNFFSVSADQRVLHLRILSSNKPKHPNVLGKQFFANQWVEFDITSKLRVGFSVATSAKDQWGAYGKCPCGSTALNTQTRTCIDRDGDGKWCDGPSSRSCKSKPCPITTTTEPAKWGPWGACSKACGPGSQTRTCSRKGQCTGPSKQGCVTRACCPRTCNVGFGAKSCDQMYNLYAAGVHTAGSCKALEKVGCDCAGCACRSDGKWSAFSRCSKECGGGTQTRTCHNPSKGKPCAGPSKRSCNDQSCSCPATCVIGGAGAKSCDQLWYLSKHSCSDLQHGGCDCDGCLSCAVCPVKLGFGVIPAGGPDDCKHGMVLKGITDPSCNVKCSEYFAPASGVMVCKSPGAATTTLKCVPKQCPSIRVSNGDVTYSRSKPFGRREQGSVARVKCHPGYRPSHNTPLTCNTRATVMWDGPSALACVPKQCPQLTVSHGKVYFSDPAGKQFGRQQQGSVATFRCYQGFRAVAKTRKTCTDGVWKGPSMSCVACAKISHCAVTVTCTTAKNSQCRKCASSHYLHNGAKDSCPECSNRSCERGKYRSGSCGGTTNAFRCHGCSHATCPEGQYRSGSCGGTTNSYRCHTCTTKCKGGQYLAGTCSGTSHTACKTCSHASCPKGHYRSGSCGGTKNGYTCHKCTTKCEAGQYLYGKCGGTSNYSCRGCSHAGCPKGQFRSGSCGGTKNGYSCHACTKCKRGQYAYGKCGGTSNYSCRGCSHTSCPKGQFRRGSCGGTTNGYSCHICATKCKREQYLAGKCGGTSHTACRWCSHKTCPKGQYRSGSCGGTKNGYSCHKCTTSCPAGRHRSGHCGGTSNYSCQRCPDRHASKFSKGCYAISCKPGYKPYKGKCVPCHARGVRTYSSGCHARNCIGGYKESKGKCVHCGVPHVLRYVSSSTSLSMFGSCGVHDCQPGYYTEDAYLRFCSPCRKPGVTRYSFQCRAHSCSKGYVLHNGACRRCPTKCKFPYSCFPGEFKCTEHKCDLKKSQWKRFQNGQLRYLGNPACKGEYKLCYRHDKHTVCMPIPTRHSS